MAEHRLPVEHEHGAHNGGHDGWQIVRIGFAGHAGNHPAENAHGPIRSFKDLIAKLGLGGRPRWAGGKPPCHKHHDRPHHDHDHHDHHEHHLINGAHEVFETDDYVPMPTLDELIGQADTHHHHSADSTLR